MIKATYLNHSGFLVELPSVTLLFDWWNGELPALPAGKPLLIFASHMHNDHLSLPIFSLPADTFVLGSDIPPHWLERKGVSPEALKKCHFMGGNETSVPLPGITVETLHSTDEGVAFLVSTEGTTVFDAGDLNWWHWEGEPDPWNPDMEINFKRYAEPLRGRYIDLAMLPLDPRLKEDGFRGPKYFLELADIQHFLPMHQWNDFAFTGTFLSVYPVFSSRTHPVSGPGMEITFP